MPPARRLRSVPRLPDPDVTQLDDGSITDTTPEYVPAPRHRSVYDNRFQHFAKALRGETPCTCTGDDGVAIQSILDAIYLSSEQKREVQITIPA